MPVKLAAAASSVLLGADGDRARTILTEGLNSPVTRTRGMTVKLLAESGPDAAWAAATSLLDLLRRRFGILGSDEPL